MISVMKTGGRVTNYSNRFTLKGVTGVFPAAVITGLKSVTTTDGPATQKDTTEALPAPAEAGDFGVPYLEQTGIMKFAPMQKLPPTKITKKDMKPLYPTTSFQIARTWLPTPKQRSTTTQSRTYKFSSMENTVGCSKLTRFGMSFADSTIRSLPSLSLQTTWKGSSPGGRIERSLLALVCVCRI